MGKFVDLHGHRFGRLVVLERAGTAKGGSAIWRCLCDCGKFSKVNGNSLRSGSTLSCGCLGAERRFCASYKHGSIGTRLYRIWSGMIERCHNPNNRNYKNYGSRGIIVCNEWRLDFTAFQTWALANGYQDDLTIDRKENDGPYSPQNCRWISLKEQQNHKRDNRLLTFNGETHNITEWAKITGINRGTISSRLDLGWSAEKIFSAKPQKKIIIIFNGESHSISEWSRITGINIQTIHSRLKRGWPVENLFLPPQQ